MLLLRFLYSQIKINSYFLLGLCFGLVFTLNFISFDTDLPCENGNIRVFPSADPDINMPTTTDEYEPKINLQNKPLQAKKAVKNILRPRYYSTELGMRQKLFVAVFTSEQNINYQAIAINKTLAHLANKIKFFITANIVKNNLNLTNIVGFTDTREILKPFHVIKYISDNYLEDYDYFYFISDAGFVNGRKLLEIVNGISVSEDVYLGTIAEKDSHYCSLEAGMLLSNSVVKKVKENLEWCVRNSYSKEYFENIGRCVTHSSGLRCTQSLQGQVLTSYKLPSGWNLNADLKTAIEKDSLFDDAVSVYPVKNYADFYSLQMYYSRLHLQAAHREISSLRSTATKRSGYSEWPAGTREDQTLPAPPPPDRFHQPRFEALLGDSTLMPDDWTNVLEHKDADKKDIDYVIQAAIKKVQNNNPNLKYHSMLNGYRRFDPSRGMAYLLDLHFTDTLSVKEKPPILKRMEVFKPLGRAAVLAVPYVTENTRVVMVMNVWQHEAAAGEEFVRRYEANCMDRKDKTYLLLVLIYSAEAPSKGDQDAFNTIKTVSLELSEKFKADGLKIGWVSIRLPPSALMPGLLKIAMADLALRKVPVDSLILLGRPHMDFKPDFLNRVRMNTIQGYQVFSAVGFQRYRPGLGTGPTPSKGAGRFAPWDFSVTSFYSRDYVTVRKLIQETYPIVRSDRDIETLLSKAEDNLSSVFEMFVVHSPELHAFRAAEPGLVFDYDETLFCPPDYNFKNTTEVTPENAESSIAFGKAVLTQKCLDTLARDDFSSVTIGTRSQLAKLIFDTGL